MFAHEFARSARVGLMAGGLAVGLLASGLLAPTSAVAQETIKIGAPLALTGGLADEGKKQDVVWKMWVERSTPPAASRSATRN